MAQDEADTQETSAYESIVAICCIAIQINGQRSRSRSIA